MSSNGLELLDRTVGCGEVTEEDAGAGREVVLTGWVHRRRDLGQLIFIEVRDRTGSVQVVFDPSENAEAHKDAEQLRAEYVVGIRGVVRPREQPNPEHPTGMVEVRGHQVALHNRATHVPIQVDDDTEASEEIRLKYRYVDLRRPKVQRPLFLRHQLGRAARGVLDGQGFVEVETPMLTRSTPEGARDYLVPSRVHPGQFYALPQSPQLFKQLLMVSGFEKYFQFVRCFRDEDLRADRQPEFTQIDIEMSFATPEKIYGLLEEMVATMFAEIGVEIPRPFRRMPYDEAMRRFGIDRPDLRFGMEIQDPGDSVAGTGFRVFDGAIDAGGMVRGIVAPGAAATSSRKVLDGWQEQAKRAGAGGLVWIKLEEGKISSPALKALGEERCKAIAEALGAGTGDVALLVADSQEICERVLGTLRLSIAEELDLIPADRWELCWVEDFPLLEWDEDAGRFVAKHHPFTAPRWDELDKLAEDPGSVRAQAYDLVLNGTEIAGGSIRIHRQDVQDQVFRALGIDEEEAEDKFGFLLGALASGAPPHGGIAVGFDRTCALLSGCESIRDVIAFPKTTSASCLMTESPSPVDEAQLRELHLQVLKPQATGGSGEGGDR